MKKLLFALLGLKQITTYKIVSQQVLSTRRGQVINELSAQLIEKLQESGAITITTEEEKGVVCIKATINVKMPK